MYKIVAKSWGGTVVDMYIKLSYEQAYEICEGLDWEYDNGYVWDLEIEEDEEEYV